MEDFQYVAREVFPSERFQIPRQWFRLAPQQTADRSKLEGHDPLSTFAFGRVIR